jgi:hypothetical protein
LSIAIFHTRSLKQTEQDGDGAEDGGAGDQEAGGGVGLVGAAAVAVAVDVVLAGVASGGRLLAGEATAELLVLALERLEDGARRGDVLGRGEVGGALDGATAEGREREAGERNKCQHVMINAKRKRWVKTYLEKEPTPSKLPPMVLRTGKPSIDLSSGLLTMYRALPMVVRAGNEMLLNWLSLTKERAPPTEVKLGAE